MGLYLWHRPVQVAGGWIAELAEGLAVERAVERAVWTAGAASEGMMP